MFLSDVRNRIDVDGLPGVIHAHNRLCARGDEGLDFAWVDVAIGQDVAKDGLRAEREEHVGRGDKANGRGDDFVILPDSKCGVGAIQRRRGGV